MDVHDIFRDIFLVFVWNGNDVDIDRVTYLCVLFVLTFYKRVIFAIAMLDYQEGIDANRWIIPSP